MNKLEKFFWEEKKSHTIHKWHHYFEIYHRYFQQFSDSNPIILEIGVGLGGSVEMWNHYFDGKCQIYGIDINPNCKQYEKDLPNLKIFIGDQGDPIFLEELKTQIPKCHIIIDDGSHVQSDMIVSFEHLWDHTLPGGIYLIEDLHCCYWAHYGGGWKNPATFIEYTKPMIDTLNEQYIQEIQEKSKLSKEIKSLCYYDSVLVIEKYSVYTVKTATVRGPGV